MSRYGTANEVIRHFWPEGAKKAVLVENKIGEDQGNILGMAKNLANGQPMIPIPEDKIPANTMSLLKDLGVQKVSIVGKEITSTTKNNLNSIGINITEKIQSNNETELEGIIRNQTFKRMNNDSLIVVAVGNFKNVISAPNLLKSKSYLISNVSEINNAVQTINENNISKVKVVGKPDLATTISSTLMNETNAEIDQISGRGMNASQIASNITRRNIPEFAKQFQRNHTRWMQGIEQNATKMRGLANETINKVQAMINDYNATELNETLNEAHNLFEQGNFLEARTKAREAQNQLMKIRWMKFRDNATRFKQVIREETESLQEKVQELRRVNKEFGNYMQQNMTIEQRLETIKTFQNRRKNQIRKVINQATQIGIGNITGKDNGNILNQVIRGPKPFKNQTRGPQTNNQTKTNQTNPGNNKGNGKGP